MVSENSRGYALGLVSDGAQEVDWMQKYQDLLTRSQDQADRYEASIANQVKIINRLQEELAEEKKKPKAFSHERGKW